MEKPWIAHYDQGITPDITYPEIPVDRFLSEAAEQYGDRTATVFGAKVGKRLMEASLTWEQLNDLTDRFAAGLQDIGVQKGDRVALMFPNCPQFVIAAHAVWRIGAVVVCCNPLYVQREIEHLLRDSGATTFICMSAFYDKVRQALPGSSVDRMVTSNIKDYFPFVLRMLFTLTKERKEGHRVDISGHDGACRFADLLAGRSKPTPVDVGPGDTSTLIYTGGTTGKPKGAELVHANQVANAVNLNAWAKSRKGEEVMLAVMPFFHIYGLSVVMNTSVAGAITMVLVPNPRDLEHVLATIEKNRVSFYLGVPTMFAAVNNHPDLGRYDLSSMRFAASAAAPLAPEIADRFEKATRGRMVQAYGLTETIAACMNPVESPRSHSIGIPLQNSELRVVDPEDPEKEMPVGEIGEIVLKGPTVMRGYWKRPDATAEAMVKGPDGSEGWFRSGDMGRMDQDGFFYLVDRKKELIICGGYNVYPTEVEAVLYEHPDVLEAAVIGVPHETRGETVKAFVVPREGKNPAADEIVEFCKDRLAAYKVPRMVEFREVLPKSLIGKVLRRELREEELGQKTGA
ncbi:MAG: long-chain-fatty-acid--CoA ligase [Desulfatibacillaceae bacterium]